MIAAALATSSDLLAALLPEWQLLLQGWSTSGQLTAAAREALVLKADPPALTALVSQWSAGDFTGIPPIVLLSGADMAGAMGAYAISAGTIYLNADWLATANKDQILAVLTEELGHHLDGLLNLVDTSGDEGRKFASLLSGSANLHQELDAQEAEDSILIGINGSETTAEAATNSPTYSLTPKRTTINEGEDIEISGFAANVPTGTILYYTLSGTNITYQDTSPLISLGALDGSTRVASGGAFTFTKNISNDLLTEGSEKLSVKLFTDTKQSQLVASTTITILDASTQNSLKVAPSAASVNEGSQVVFVITSNHLSGDVLVGYTIKGIDINDIAKGDYTGILKVGPAGSSVTVSLTIVNDQNTEGDESLVLTLFPEWSGRRDETLTTATVSVRDTSKTPFLSEIIGTSGSDSLKAQLDSVAYGLVGSDLMFAYDDNMMTAAAEVNAWGQQIFRISRPAFLAGGTGSDRYNPSSYAAAGTVIIIDSGNSADIDVVDISGYSFTFMGILDGNHLFASDNELKRTLIVWNAFGQLSSIEKFIYGSEEWTASRLKEKILSLKSTPNSSLGEMAMSELWDVAGTGFGSDWGPIKDNYSEGSLREEIQKIINKSLSLDPPQATQVTLSSANTSSAPNAPSIVNSVNPATEPNAISKNPATEPNAISKNPATEPNATSKNPDNPLAISGTYSGNTSAKSPAGKVRVLDSSTNQVASTTRDSSVKSLAQLTVSTPLKTAAKSLLDRYVINDPDSGTKRKASADDAGFLDFTLKTGSLKSLTAEIQLASEVKATAYVKVNPNTGDAYDFTYDPVTGLGAELLDTNKNGLVDILKIHLQDGAKGDADGLVNGEIRDPGVLAEAPRAPVYRFYRNGVHFYTTSDTERDNVIKNSYASGIGYADLSANPQSKDPITGGGWGYRFEGVAYQALDTQGTALYRFFSPGKGYHFVTTNTAEALNVIKNSVGSSYDLSNAQGQKLLDNGWGFQYEGSTYKVSTIAQTGMDQPVYRFFNGTKGVHFYSSSMAEAKSVIANSLGAQYATDSWVTSTADALKQNPLTTTPAPLATGWGYSFEGIAWYV